MYPFEIILVIPIKARPALPTRDREVKTKVVRKHNAEHLKQRMRRAKKYSKIKGKIARTSPILKAIDD